MNLRQSILAALLLVLLMASLFALVWLGKADASVYTTTALSLIAGIGAALATAFNPAKAAAMVPQPVPAAAAAPQPESQANA